MYIHHTITHIWKVRIHEDDLHLLVNSDGKLDPVLSVKEALTYGPFVLENEAFATRLAKGQVSTLKTAPRDAHLVYKNANGEEFDIANPTFEDWHKFGTFLLSQKEKYGITSWDSQYEPLSDDIHHEFLQECSVSSPDDDGMVIVRSTGDFEAVPVTPPIRHWSSRTEVNPIQTLRQCCTHPVTVELCEAAVTPEDMPICSPNGGSHPWASAVEHPTLFEFTYLYEDENGDKVIASSPDDAGYRDAVAAGRQTRINAW